MASWRPVDRTLQGVSAIDSDRTTAWRSGNRSLGSVKKNLGRWSYALAVLSLGVLGSTFDLLSVSTVQGHDPHVTIRMRRAIQELRQYQMKHKLKRRYRQLKLRQTEKAIEQERIKARRLEQRERLGSAPLAGPVGTGVGKKKGTEKGSSDEKQTARSTKDRDGTKDGSGTGQASVSEPPSVPYP